MADKFGFGGLKFNIDFPIILCLIVIGFRMRLRYCLPTAYVLMAISFSVLVLIGLGAIYITDIYLIGNYLAFASYWPWHLILPWFFAIFGLMVALYALKRRVDFARVWLSPVILMIAAIGYLGTRDTFERVTGRNWMTSGAVNLFRIMRSTATFKVSLDRPFPGRTMAADLATERPPRVLSISVESLGVLRDHGAQQKVVAGLLGEVSRWYSVDVTTQHFQGPTLSGEMRELCGLLAEGVPGVSAAKRLDAVCLPATLRRQGYATLGVHGNVRQFYNRQRVYPMFGFGKTMFLDDFRRLSGGLNHCRAEAFGGVCDRAAVGAAIAFLGGKQLAFAHVMTLQGHYPLAPSDLGSADCRPYPGLRDAELCLYANQQAEILRRIGEQLSTAETRPDVVYIYGDHAPPFATRVLRGAFMTGRVPYIVLRLR